ncbi:OPT oligopeptide transporter protein-domain-containing protein [Suillus fuscotomentosus]|uniref:OPT oligopeptide transporter protein-domain-containing protein n=1 Tax=Suillus fuscotomentosus TaxID=1912939 RepID=A0AAD4EGK6_9AGAM|nr:OPT oligopeptide transporter protein-domain-containing protein [Suillus fuscotomentosus]KAG1905875.1 OPT oligopeptide transporter protein-domain-containing protein [Suillus fuscotomentosus]
MAAMERVSSLNDEKSIDVKEKSKSYRVNGDIETSTGEDTDEITVLQNERDIATHVISVDDDPSLNPWTFRAFFIGLGLSAFGGSLAQIYYFKPQTVNVSLMFLGIISYVIGLAMETFIPRHGLLRYLNPGPFNKKENAFIIIMASAAANSALATEVLAVQRLYYNITPNAISSVFLLFSSQLLGYGIGGLMRGILLYPSKMLYPGVLPLLSMLDAFYYDGIAARRKLKVFYFVFTAIFIWELFPEWIFPLLTGVSIFCLAAPDNAAVSRVFGGSNGNEGLGLLSLCFDWQYISGGLNPMTIPLKAQLSSFIGYILCTVVFVAVFYNNIWESRNLPFLAQLLFYENGTVYDQTLIMNSNYEVDPTLVAEQGLPFYAGTWIVNLLAMNLALAATFTHLLLWNKDDLSAAWTWINMDTLRSWRANFDWKFWKHSGEREVPANTEDLDPHYREMLKYPDAPNSWYFLTFVLSFIVGLVVIYETNSTLPWWGFVIAVVLGAVSILFFGALYAITGIGLSIQTLVQMIAGYLHNGRPMANMFFNTVSQAMLLLRDLKIAQYAKLPPRAAFAAQVIGTLLGAVLNYMLMNSIIDSQREILLSVQGTNIWSGQQPQSYNSQAIAWGGLAHELFSYGQRYQWVPLSYLIGLVAPLPFWIIHRYWPRLRHGLLLHTCHLLIMHSAYIGWLCVGINSSILAYFTVAFLSQWWLRTRYPRWFTKYNYLVGAALDGGTQVMIFFLSFAVQGAAGAAHLFPAWWGANQGGNYDRCSYLN